MAPSTNPPNKFQLTEYTPAIPPHVSSLLPKSHKKLMLQANTPDKELKRKASQLSTDSALFQASDYLDIHKEQINIADILLKESINELRLAVQGNQSDTDIKEAIQDCLEKRARLAAEDVTIQR